MKIVGYHGLLGSPQQFAGNSQLDAVAQSLGCQIEYALSRRGVWWWFARESIDRRLVQDLQTFRNAAGTVAIGFSAGADMAMRIACELQPSAIVVYAGELSAFERMPWSRPRCPALFLGSPDDPLVPPENGHGKLACAWGKNGRFVKLSPGGHHWLSEANEHIRQFLASV